MKFLSLLAPAVLFVFAPSAAFAAATLGVGNMTGATTFIGNIVGFMNNVLVPAIFALAFLVFLWGMFNTFILGGGDEEKQEKGKQLMVYSIVGFVVMISLWGIVNFVTNSLGFGGGTIQMPNTIETGSQN